MPPELRKALAAALGLSFSAGMSDAAMDAVIRKELKKLGLTEAADPAVVASVFAAVHRAGHKKAGRVVAKGPWWQLRAQGEDVTELLIYGDIGESWFGESVTAKDLVEQLQNIKTSVINARINSFGGSVADGIAIYNALRRHPAEIVTDNDGVAISIASLILMAGDTVRMADNARFMMHAPWGGAVGNAEELRQYADVLDGFADAMTSAYVRKAGEAKSEQIRAYLKDGKDHWFSPAEAKSFGFVDEITESLAAAASFNPSRFRDPAAAAAHTTEEGVSVMNWKALAAALGVRIAANATDEQIRAAVLKYLQLKSDAKDEDVTAAIEKRNSPNPEPSGPAPAESPEAAHARQALQARNTQIRGAFQPFRTRNGVAELEMACLADTGLTAEQASQKLLAHLGAGAEPLAGGLPRTEAGLTDSEKRVGAMVHAALQRAGIAKDPDTGKAVAIDPANPYHGMTLREVARECVRASGRSVTGLSGVDIARAALVRAAGGQGTSDFPVFLENVLQKAVMSGFQAITPSYSRFCKVGTVTDFRPNRRILPGMIANLELVNEFGEYKNKNLPDGEKESISAKRRGNIIEITPETIVNDDLGAIVDTARGLGMAGPRTIDRVVFALLAQNANLGPTLVKTNQTLIHANHGNSGTGAPSVTALSTLYQKMAKQKFPGSDQEIMDLVPRIAVANTIVAGEIRVHNDAQYDPANNNQKPNKVRGVLTDIVGTERMPATIYYLFADPNIAPVIEVVFLDGVQAVRVVQEENFRTAGLAWRGELNADAGAVDYRGIVYSTGA